MRAIKCFFLGLFLMVAPVAARAQTPTIATWTSGSTYTYFIWIPPNPRPGNPWVILGPATSATGGDWNTQIVADFVSRGIYVASIWLPGLNGSNEGYGLQYAKVDPWVTFMISTYALAAKPSVWLQSRAALDIGTWAVINPTKVLAISGEYPIVGGPLEYPGDNSTLWNAWNMTQAQAEAFAPTVTPNNYTANIVSARVPVRFWQGSADTVAQTSTALKFTASFIANAGPTASEIVVLGMGHVTYYNKGMVDFLDQYLPTQPLSSISCPYGLPRTGSQSATLVSGTNYNPASFNQIRNRYLWCQRSGF